MIISHSIFVRQPPQNCQTDNCKTIRTESNTNKQLCTSHGSKRSASFFWQVHCLVTWFYNCLAVPDRPLRNANHVFAVLSSLAIWLFQASVRQVNTQRILRFLCAICFQKQVPAFGMAFKSHICLPGQHR